MVDGSIPYFERQREGALWEKLVQIDDGALTALEASEFLNFSRGSSNRARPEGCLALAVFLILTFLPAFWLRK